MYICISLIEMNPVSQLCIADASSNVVYLGTHEVNCICEILISLVVCCSKVIIGLET